MVRRRHRLCAGRHGTRRWRGRRLARAAQGHDAIRVLPRRPWRRSQGHTVVAGQKPAAGVVIRGRIVDALQPAQQSLAAQLHAGRVRVGAGTPRDSGVLAGVSAEHPLRARTRRHTACFPRTGAGDCNQSCSGSPRSASAKASSISARSTCLHSFPSTCSSRRRMVRLSTCGAVFVTTNKQKSIGAQSTEYMTDRRGKLRLLLPARNDIVVAAAGRGWTILSRLEVISGPEDDSVVATRAARDGLARRVGSRRRRRRQAPSPG